MITFEAKIPEPVLNQAKELAEREQIPLDHLISLAVTQAAGVWSNESYISLRAKRASREKFEEALKQVPDVAAPDYDQLPDGYQKHSAASKQSRSESPHQRVRPLGPCAADVRRLTSLAPARLRRQEK